MQLDELRQRRRGATSTDLVTCLTVPERPFAWDDRRFAAIRKCHHTIVLQQEVGWDCAAAHVSDLQARVGVLMTDLLAVPERYRDAFESFVRLPTPTRTALIEALQAAPPMLFPDDLGEQLSVDLGLDPLEATQIVHMLGSIYRSGLLETQTPNQVAQSLTEGLHQDAAETAKLVEHLEAALSLGESLGITAKAYGVLSERERSLCSARAITDIRPVFSNDPAKVPAAVIVIHTLRLAFHTGDEVKEFYLSLNRAQIGALQSELGRALEKEQTLTTLLGKQGVACLAMDYHVHAH